MLSVAVTSLTGCTSGGSTPTARPQMQLRWLITAHALHEISAIDSAVARTAFDGASTFVIRGPAGAGVPSGWNSTLVADYKSYAQLASDLAQGVFPTGARAVLYDDESWGFTPVEEQRDPSRYIQLAAQLCHQHGLLLIAAPAMDLTTVLSPNATSRRAAYLDLGLAAIAARSADVVDIQAQSLEADSAAYRSFVASAAQQARQAGGAHVRVLAGLSTGPAGKTVTGAQLTDAVTATRSVVDGFWMNVPGQSAECPTCTQPLPGLAVTVLRALYHL